MAHRSRQADQVKIVAQLPLPKYGQPCCLRRSQARFAAPVGVGGLAAFRSSNSRLGGNLMRKPSLTSPKTQNARGELREVLPRFQLCTLPWRRW